MISPKVGAEEIREALRNATVLAFPTAGTRQSPGSWDSGDATSLPLPAGRGGANGDLEFAFLPLTDLGNAERLSGRFRDELRYCPALGWLAWDGRRWLRCAEGHKKRAEHETARAIQDEAKAVATTPGKDFRVGGTKDAPIFYSDKLRAWGRASEGAQS